jgi:hypothetical protein
MIIRCSSRLIGESWAVLKEWLDRCNVFSDLVEMLDLQILAIPGDQLSLENALLLYFTVLPSESEAVSQHVM